MNHQSKVAFLIIVGDDGWSRQVSGSSGKAEECIITEGIRLVS